MTTGHLRYRASTLALATAVALTSAPALAQVDEIFVTARKREETLINAPVVVTVFSADQLAQNAISSLEAISQLTPQLQIGEAQTPMGGSISMRGVSTGSAELSSDQSILIAIDNVGIPRATITRHGQHDLQQVEVLKGPQALFFGKNSPGGIIAIRTQDPTDAFFASARGGYEINADQAYGEAILSGPLTDALGARAVFYASDMKGYRTNAANGLPGYLTPQKRGPDYREYFGRLTVAYEPNDAFNLRLKGSYSSLEGSEISLFTERLVCPIGNVSANPLVAPVDDCKLSGNYLIGAGNAAGLNSSLNPYFADDKGFIDLEAVLFTAEANYNITDALTLTSVTGYYLDQHLSNMDVGQVPGSTFLPSAAMLATDAEYRMFSQEVRLATDFDSPVNGMIGVLFDDTQYSHTLVVGAFIPPGALGPGIPPVALPIVAVPTFTTVTDGRTYSLFGELTWDITDELELSGGARWTQETKKLSTNRNGLSLAMVDPSVTFVNISPEVTLTWKPQDNLTFFGSYKQGFKSGGFNQGTAASAIGFPPFAEEQVKGGEMGAKASLFDNTLFVSVAGYRYKYEDLQLTEFTGTPPVLLAAVTNAGGSRAMGAELSATYTPPEVEGLSLRTAIAYNDHQFTEYLAACYVGQTAALGCLPIGPFGTLAQDRAGEPVILSPKWSATLGFTLDRPLPSDVLSSVNYILSMDAAYSSTYDLFVQAPPYGKQKGYWLLNASASLYDGANEGWKFDVIVRNLTNERYVSSGFQAAPSPDVLGFANREREIIFQLTVRPSALLSD